MRPGCFPLSAFLFALAASIATLLPHARLTQAAAEAEPAQTKPAASEQTAQPNNAKQNNAKQTDAKQNQKAIGVAVIELTGDYPEGPPAAGIFAQLKETLREGLARLDKAAKDDRVAAVILKIDDPTLGWAKVHEFRMAIAAVRAAGKPVYAWVAEPTNGSYMVATACDKIYMPESGTLMLLGLHAEVTFYKNLFDKLDVQADVLRVGEFKNAAEPFTRTEMSAPFRKELEELLDDFYAELVAAIASGRGLEKAAVDHIIDNAPLMAADAKTAGLIDGLAYEDALTDIIKDDLKAGSVKVGKEYGKKKLDADFSGLSGFIELMNLIAGVEQKTAKTSAPKIALIYASGAIMTGKSNSDLLGSATLGSETLVKAIEKARDDESVKAIVLRIDSPGGSALASDLMWHALESAKAKKPLIASMGDVAASGGYYIAMGADKIFAEPATVTGSIGVVGGKLAVRGLLEKVGVTTSVVARGDNSGAMSILTGFSESERKAMQKLLDAIYDQFTRKAAAGRGMPLDKLEPLARGRIYSGSRAKTLGLIDEVGTLSDALAKAKSAARDKGLLEKDAEPELLLLPKPGSPLEQLFGPLEASASAGPLSMLPVELQESLSGLQIINLLARERTLTVLPFTLRIR